ncbi:hypothetical protein QE357_005193 [Siphonobacter sp. BAB-5404]|nr:hypothetical protein [Siphonobacter sp. SORGH_AS_0500]
MNLIGYGRSAAAVSDITYIPLLKGFAYLSLVTDAYSRKIVDWTYIRLCNWKAFSCFKNALKVKTGASLIHHRSGDPVRSRVTVL